MTEVPRKSKKRARRGVFLGGGGRLPSLGLQVSGALGPAFRRALWARDGPL